jgi:arylsulfatase A-like enzyme
LRLPLIVSWPKRFQQGATCTSLTELVDLYPTLVFDCEKDPQELANLAGKPDYATAEAQLPPPLAEWQGRTADDGRKALSASTAESMKRNRNSTPRK